MRQSSILRWMALIAALGLNIGLVRAFAVAELSGQHLYPLDLGFLIFFALQIASWRYLRTSGRRRRFWLGFVASGIAATLAVCFLAEANEDLNNWYTGAISDLCYDFLPARIDFWLTNEHWDWFLVIAYFLPELAAGTLGGLIALGFPTRPQGFLAKPTPEA